MRKIFITSLFLVLLVFGCKTYRQETRQLNSILLSYKDSISSSPHLYVVVSRFSCSGCVQEQLKQLEKKLLKSDKKKITLISCTTTNIPLELFSKVTYVDDTLKLVDKVFPSFANLTIFETDKETVNRYKNLSRTDELWLPDFVIKFIDREL